MSQCNPKQKFFVVFEGRALGIYSTWTECDKQVNRFKENKHKSYTSYEEAEFHWACYRNNNAKDNGDSQSNFKTESKGSSWNSSSTDPGSRTSNFGQEISSDSFIIEQSMQNLLLQVCHILQFPSPWYTIQEVKYIQDVQFRRFYGTVATREAGRQIICLGNFKSTDYDAQEDVSLLLINKLLVATGKKIKDFNFFNVQVMQERLQKLVHDKLEMQLEIDLLRDQIKQLSTNKGGPNT